MITIVIVGVNDCQLQIISVIKVIIISVIQWLCFWRPDFDVIFSYRVYLIQTRSESNEHMQTEEAILAVRAPCGERRDGSHENVHRFPNRN